MKIHSPDFVILRYKTRETYPEKKNYSCIQGVKRNIPNMFQIASCVMFELSWKFRE